VPGLCLHLRFLKPKWTDRQERESLCKLYEQMFFSSPSICRSGVQGL
jgi:hypothetical protein